jgi:hypothetical protein
MATPKSGGLDRPGSAARDGRLSSISPFHARVADNQLATSATWNIAPKCGGEPKIIAAALEQPVIEKILRT